MDGKLFGRHQYPVIWTLVSTLGPLRGTGGGAAGAGVGTGYGIAIVAEAAAAAGAGGGGGGGMHAFFYLHPPWTIVSAFGSRASNEDGLVMGI